MIGQQIPDHLSQAILRPSPQIQPPYNGRRWWFTDEEYIEDGCALTDLSPDKAGPALRNRLDGDAAMYKSQLDRC